jgi:hypothetical protein
LIEQAPSLLNPAAQRIRVARKFRAYLPLSHKQRFDLSRNSAVARSSGLSSTCRVAQRWRCGLYRHIWSIEAEELRYCQAHLKIAFHNTSGKVLLRLFMDSPIKTACSKASLTGRVHFDHTAVSRRSSARRSCLINGNRVAVTFRKWIYFQNLANFLLYSVRN